MAGPAASDVPDRYDVVFSLNDGSTYGFLYADSVESNLPFRTHKALYSYSPTFLERQNLSNTYGDNFQDFFLTASQADFSAGEQQHFFRINDPDSVRKYWAGSNVDPVTVPGNITLTTPLTSLTRAATAACSGSPQTEHQIASPYAWWVADSTNLYGISAAGAATSVGAHGLGCAPQCLAVDGGNVYIAGNDAANNGVAVRKYNLAGAAFSSFSTTVCNQIVFLNNILYGYIGYSATAGQRDSLVSFDTSGNPTVQFQWKTADGSSTVAVASASYPLVAFAPYGGQLFMLRLGTGNPELWVYDGAGCRMVGQCPPDFNPGDLAVNNGIVYVGGYTTANVGSGSALYRPQIYYYSNGSIGKLWESQTTTTSAAAPPLDGFQNGVLFQNPSNKNLLVYDIGTGGVHTVATASTLKTALHTASFLVSAVLGLDTGSSTQEIYGIPTSYSSTGYIQTSQYDFDNTLTKVFRAIKLDADLPANTSVDIAYQLDGCGGTYTNLQTGATSGTEYLLPANTTGHSISVKVTLNSATGSATPTLKHVYVRAAPTLQQFRRREYLFDLAGGAREDLGKTSRRTRDMTAYPKDPITACNDLVKIATQTIPFTVYDRFTTAGMTVIADLQQNQAGYDGFAIYEVRPNVFIGRINLREV